MTLRGLFRANEERRRKISTRKQFHFNTMGRLRQQRFHAFALAAMLAPATWSAAARVPQLDTQDSGTQGSAAKIAPSVLNDPELAAGFQLLYQLKFHEARQRFRQWEQERPAEPLGPALEAASSLFEEFYRKGVLTSEFFLDDKRLLGGIKGLPDADLERQFASARQRADKLARERLQNQPKDPDALFALTLVGGMQADDLFLIQKRQLESLRHLREADRSARDLLQIVPDADDAYAALGIANYIIGCLPGYKRAMLWVDGVHGDKALGIQQVARTASSEHAHYLRPFAQLMLALAALREKNPDLSRRQLQALVMEFPENPLFATELAKVTPVVTRAASPAGP
jgi:hypothetical protein